jgi:hypothetical protein
MTDKSGTWTPERRAAHRKMLQEKKPWLKSTGPKTTSGKKRVAQNAAKHDLHSAAFLAQVKILRILLRAQKIYLKNYLGHQRNASRSAL